jgi:hypothetical protein
MALSYLASRSRSTREADEPGSGGFQRAARREGPACWPSILVLVVNRRVARERRTAANEGKAKPVRGSPLCLLAVASRPRRNQNARGETSA